MFKCCFPNIRKVRRPSYVEWAPHIIIDTDKDEPETTPKLTLEDGLKDDPENRFKPSQFVSYMTWPKDTKLFISYAVENKVDLNVQV